MHDGLLPLFPLSVVLLPRNDLPLHIFEERYKLMIGELLAAGGGEFGVVLAAGGGISAAGCTATVEKVMKRYEDGRLDILALGRRRFHIRSLDQQLDYLRGEVEMASDDVAVAAPALVQQALEAWRQLAEPGSDEPAASDPELSFLLARDITDLEFRQRLLVTNSEPERLQLLSEFIPGYVDRTSGARRLKKAAGLNGHGKHPDLDAPGGTE